MNQSSTVRCLGLVGLLVVASVVWSASGGAQKRSIDATWQQSTSVSIRLGVRGKEGQAEPYEAMFTVFTLDYPNGRVEHKIQKRINPGQFAYLYFPEDINAKALPGKYGWTCTVGDQVVALGRFEYAGVGAQTDQAAILK